MSVPYVDNKDESYSKSKAEWYRHKRRGTSYKIVGQAVLQTEQPLKDNQQLVIYTGDDGTLWARPVEEFFDGRFEKLSG